jgi:hypothetical protein
LASELDPFSDYFADERASLFRWKGSNFLLGTFSVLLFLPPPLQYFGVVSAAITLTSEGLRRNHRSKSEERLLKFIDTIEFDWDVLSELDVDDESMERLHQAFIAAKFSGMDRTNSEEIRGRGGDEKGPALSENMDEFNKKRERVDPALHEKEYEGLEGPLRHSEHLLRDADLVYAKQAEARWKISEAGDADLIEAGVERLGDLVATEWFEKNAQDGAISEVMKSDDPQ